MNKIFFVLAIFAVALSSCGNSDSKQMATTKTKEAIIITPDKLAVKIDPVCQMSMENHPIADTLTYNGKLYGFCSDGCMNDFKANPEKFLAELPKE